MTGRLWCEDLARVTLQRTETPAPITFVMPYYENRAFFGQQLTGWAHYPAPLSAWLRVIVVDDGSPRRPAVDVARRFLPLPFPLRVFRIEVDLRWNWLGARNLGAFHAVDGWMLLTDMDHVVPAETFGALVYGAAGLDPDGVYAFARREHTGAMVTPHSASFLMTRATFWRIGGYDEALAGYYGTDGVYRREVIKHAAIRVLANVELVRYEYVGDSSTDTYLRKQPMDAAVRRIVQARPRDWRPRVLSFPAHEERLEARPS